MKKGFKKLVAVALSAGLFASSFAGITPVKADETNAIKKGTVITDFKEITDVEDLEPGVQYFFSTEEYGAEDAVASLPDGSAILQFAGTDLTDAIEAGTFRTALPEYYESYKLFRDKQYDFIRLAYALTEEEVYIMATREFGFDKVPSSWDEMIQMEIEMNGESWFEEEYGAGSTGLEKFLEAQNRSYEEYLQYFYEDYPEQEAEYLAKCDCATWTDYVDREKANQQNRIDGLVDSFANSCGQSDRDGYVTVVQFGPGFDDCEYGTIAYLEEFVMPTAETGDETTDNSQAGWYYACAYGGVSYVGPFYLYSYKVNEFTEDDLIITFAEDWKTPTAATTVTKDDLTLSVVIDGEEIIIPFFEITDSSVDPANENTTITLVVGEITKVVEVCNIESGEIVKDVQISAGAPTVGLEDAVDALMETVLTEAELKLVKNGVDVDIYMTVVGKKAEELGEDKAILEKTMAKDDKAVYLDLKLFKKIGNNDPTAITEVPGGKIKVSVVVPDTIKKFADKAKVVRVHGTEVTELKTTYDAATNKLSFETDKFSTYAIVYNDASSETGTTPTPGTGTTPAPIAGDSAMIGVYMVVVVLAAAVVVMRKKAANV